MANTKHDRNGVRTASDVERRHKLGLIEPTAKDVEELKKDSVVDSNLSTTSTNPVENKVITQNINSLANNINAYKHTHDNKTVLDNITQADIDNWNNKPGGEVSQLDIITGGEPVKCDYKVDGKDVYVKRFDIGNLLNASIKSVNSGLDFTKLTVIDIKGICKYNSETNTTTFPIPYVSNVLANCISVYVGNANQVCVSTGTDRTNYTAMVEVYFTYKDE